MLLQLSCSTSHTSRGSSSLTFLIVQHVPQPAPGHSQWSQAYEPPVREGKRQPEILCRCSTDHLFLELEKQGAGSLSICWSTCEFWLCDIFIPHLSLCYLTFFKTSLSFTKRQLKNIFLPKRPGNTLNHFSVKIWAHISCCLVLWGIWVPISSSTAANSGVCDLLNLKGKGEGKTNKQKEEITGTA